MIVFRLCKSKFAEDISGFGAEKVGGRWNSKGTPMVYFSNSIALCTVEIAVHVPLGIIPTDYKIVQYRIPDKLIHDLNEKDLPKNWRTFPHSDSTQKIGDAFIRDNNNLAMKVPSAVVQDEYNFLVNPKHPEIKKVKFVKAEDFNFDVRLFK